MSDILEEKLITYAKNNLNVMLIGHMGIGKTERVKQLAKILNLNLKYYSAPTLDPFVDIVGIPVPDLKNKTIEFFKSKDLMEAEFLFFDEMNRSHPRILNAVLEIVQFKTINGVALPNLKMVWCAINPPSDVYNVEELDPALIDRFHCYVKMMPEVSLQYLSTKMEPQIALTLKTWWDTNLNDEQRKIFTPRRVEYVGMMIEKNIPFRDAIPQGHIFPIEILIQKLNKLKNPDLETDDALEPTKENLLKDPKHFIKAIKKNPRLYTQLSEVVSHFDKEELYLVKDVLELFPKDLLENFLNKKMPLYKREMLKTFQKNGIDLEKYPKLCSAAKWEIEEKK